MYMTLKIGRGFLMPEMIHSFNGCAGALMPAAVMLLVAGLLASTQLPASPSAPTVLLQGLPSFINSIGRAIAGAPGSAQPLSPSCNISYTAIEGPRLVDIAAASDGGMLWGLGLGVEVVTEPWMEAATPRQKDALWVCGSTQHPCRGKWRALHGLPNIQSIAAGEGGDVAVVDTTGRTFISRDSASFVAHPFEPDMKGHIMCLSLQYPKTSCSAFPNLGCPTAWRGQTQHPGRRKAMKNNLAAFLCSPAPTLCGS